MSVQAAKISQADLPATVELLEEMGFTCERVRMIDGPAQKVTRSDMEQPAYLKVGDGHLMCTHRLPGFQAQRTFHGMTWNFYLVI